MRIGVDGLLGQPRMTAATLCWLLGLWGAAGVASSVFGQETPPTGPEATPPRIADMLPELHLLKPFWNSDTAHRESLFFVRAEGAPTASARLYYPARKILAIHSSDGKTTFELGKDVELSPDGHELTLMPGANVPHIQESEKFPAAGAPRTIGHKVDDPARHVLFENGHWFHDQQVEVTYLHDAEPWTGEPPHFNEANLPRTIAKLRSGEPITVGVSGDSISAGGNASGPMKAPPGMPAFPELVAAQLELHYGSKVELKNRAVGGWTAQNGSDDLNELLAVNPDLVIIAYGMNDVGYRNPDLYRQTIASMLDRIHHANPAAEVILVSTMLGNPQWTATPAEMFPPYRDALASLTATGIGLADVTALWQQLLTRKETLDVIGNGVNHPNDFGHRIYAQAILAMLVDPASDSALTK